MRRLLAALLLLLALPAQATNRYVWSGGASAADCGAANGFTDACTSFLDLYNSGFGTAGSPLTSSDTVYVASDHDDSLETYGGAFTLTGPATGLPVKIISVARADSTYQTGTSDQLDTTDGVLTVTLDGSFAVYGLRIDSGSDILLYPDNNEGMYCFECYLKPGNNAAVRTDNYGRIRLVDCTISGVNDTGPAANGLLYGDTGATGVAIEMVGGSFVSTSNRTSSHIGDDGAHGSSYIISGVDFSASAASLEILGASLSGVVTNSLTPASQSFVPPSATHAYFTDILYTNTGDSDRPWWLFHWQNAGYVEAQTTYTRGGGASIAGTEIAWLFTPDEISAGYMYYSPWIYGSTSTTGSKTLTIHVANATDDLTDKEAAIECHYLGTSGEAIWSRITDLAAITASGTAQADDTTSTWTPSLTYMQKLSVSPTINQAGQFRCRVVAAVSQAFYIDPKVIVE